MFSGPHIKMTFSFTISNVAITTQKFVKNMGTKFFGNAVFKSKKVTYLFMASLDPESLFTNIPIDGTIKNAVDGLFSSNMYRGKLSKSELYYLLKLATSESSFIFDNILYKQIDGVTMGSPLGPTLANTFLCHYEKLWLDSCPPEFKPVVYRRYVV